MILLKLLYIGLDVPCRIGHNPTPSEGLVTDSLFLSFLPSVTASWWPGATVEQHRECGSDTHSDSCLSLGWSCWKAAAPRQCPLVWSQCGFQALTVAACSKLYSQIVSSHAGGLAQSRCLRPGCIQLRCWSTTQGTPIKMDTYVVWRHNSPVSAPSNVSIHKLLSESRSMHLHADVGEWLNHNHRHYNMVCDPYKVCIHPI